MAKPFTVVAEKLEDTQVLDTSSFVKADQFIRNAIYHGYDVTLINRLHSGPLGNTEACYILAAKEASVTFTSHYAGGK